MTDDRRLEMRVSAELLARIDEARGDVLRGTWIKRVLEQALVEASRPPGFRGESESAVTTAARVSAQGDNSPASARAPEYKLPPFAPRPVTS